MKKSIYLLLTIIFLSQIVYSQGVKIADNILNPHPSAMLDIEASDRGILIPQVQLADVNDAITMAGGNVNSLLVYNIGANGAGNDTVYEGFYFWSLDSTKWLRIVSGASGTDDQNIDSLTINGTRLAVFIEDGDSASTNLIGIASDTSFYSTIANNMVSDTTTLQLLRDSVNLLTYYGGVNDSLLYYVDEIGDTTWVDIKAIIDSGETVTDLDLLQDSLLTYLDEDGVLDTINLYNVIDSGETVTDLELLQDSLLTYLNEDGVIDTINLYNVIDSGETLTIISNTDSTISYIDEDGDTTVVDVQAMVDSVETLTIISNTDSTISYIDEDGDTTVIDVQAMVDSVETLTIISNTDSTISYIDEDGDTTVVDVQAMVDSIESLTIISNTDSTISYIDEDGDTTVVDVQAMVDSIESLTIISNTDSTISYIDEDGDTTVVDVQAMVDSVETLTAISNTDSTISYIDEDGDTTVVDVQAMVDSVETLTAISNTDSTISYIDEDGDTTVVDVQAMVDSVETLTIISNTDSTISYIDEDGDTTVVDVQAMVDSIESLTIISNTDSTISYIDEDGDTTVVDVQAMVDSVETLTAISNTDSTISYIDEDGDTTVVDVQAMVDSIESLTIISNTDSTISYIDEDGDTTVVDVQAMVDSVESLTDLELLQDSLLTYLDEDGVLDTINLYNIIDSGETVTDLSKLNDSLIVYTDEDGTIDTINLSSLKDHDWYELGTTNPPNSINDHIYTLGRVSIGTTTSGSDLNIGGSQTLSFRGLAASSLINSPSVLIVDAGVLGTSNLILRGSEFRFNDFDAGTASTANIRGVDSSHVALTLGMRVNQSNNILQITDPTNAPVTVIDETGNIGVKIANPSHELDVNGQVRIRTINDTNNVAGVLTANAIGVVQNLPLDTLKDRLEDHDWYEVGTTTAPDDINDNIFTQGNVGVGVLNPVFNLDVDTTINTGGHYNQFGNTILTTSPNNSPSTGNVAVGRSMINNVSGVENTGLGNATLAQNTIGSTNTAAGSRSLSNNIDGNGNVAYGYSSMTNNIDGGFNTGIGYSALNGNTEGNGNVAVGNLSLFTSTNGIGNVSVGQRSLLNSDSSDFNVAIGRRSLFFKEKGDENVAIGDRSLANMLEGQGNISLGSNAGDNLTLGDKNIIIGSNIDFPNVNDTGQLNIGNIIYGIDIDGTGNTISAGNIGIGEQSPTHRLDVNGQARIRTINDTNNVAGVLTANANGVVQNLPLDTLKDRLEDHDWYEVGTTAAPDDINDSIYTMGYVGVGTANPNAVHHVRRAVAWGSGNLPLLGIESNRPSINLYDANSVSGDDVFSFGLGANGLEMSSSPYSIDDWGYDEREVHVFIHDTGFVGINTVNPIELLEVDGGAINSVHTDSSDRFYISNAGIVQQGLKKVLNSGVGIFGTDHGGSTSRIFDVQTRSVVDDVTSDTSVLTVTAGRRVGIGTINPIHQLEVADDQNEAVIASTSYGATSGSHFIGYRGNGTQAIPTEPSSGDQLALFQGRSVVTPNSFPGMRIVAEENFTAGAKGSSITFQTALTGTTNELTRMKIDDNGNVGIGTTLDPTEKLQVIGNILASGTIVSSDKRYKRDIHTLDNAIANLMKLRGVNYFMKDEYKELGFGEGIQIGVIAQEVEKVYPELVKTNEKTGYKAVDYSKFTPILIEAVKKQQNMIDKQQQTINDLQNANQSLKAKNDTIDSNYKELKAEIEQIKLLLNKQEIGEK